MRKFKVYFEIFGKKMQCMIEGKDEKDVQNIIESKIKIAKIEAINEDDTVEFLKNMFGMD